MILNYYDFYDVKGMILITVRSVCLSVCLSVVLCLVVVLLFG